MALVRVCAPLCRELARVFPQRPFALRLGWLRACGDRAGGADLLRDAAPRRSRTPCGLPASLGLGRAYVEGSLTVDDLDAAFIVVDDWEPPAIAGRDKARLLARSPGRSRPGPAPPRSELILQGELHSTARDAAAVRYHYDVGNEFFALFLDESMTYSCAIFSRGARTLEEAQQAKLELIAQKLGLEPGQRVLDVGCGWGSFAIHAAREPASASPASRLAVAGRVARKRVAAAGLEDRVEIRIADYRQLRDEPFERSPGSAWPSTSASRRSTSTRERFDRMVSRAASFSTMRSA